MAATFFTLPNVADQFSDRPHQIIGFLAHDKPTAVRWRVCDD